MPKRKVRDRQAKLFSISYRPGLYEAIAAVAGRSGKFKNDWLRDTLASLPEIRRELDLINNSGMNRDEHI